MEGFGQLFAFSLVMLFGSYAAGSLPLFMTMSEKNLHLVSVLGAGLLLGVALAVIIPEGLQTLIKAYSASPSDFAQPSSGHARQLEADDHGHHEHQHGSTEGMDSAVGISLVLGFIFMLLIDQLANAKQQRSAVVSISGADIEVQSSGSQKRSQARSSVNWTTTLGLVVHAAADGIAMGAAAATHQMDIEFIVFLAIMLHKAPAAFGLVTFLLHEGLERQRIRRHLMIFALAAPVMAVVTFVMLAWGSGNDPVDKVNTFKATGVAMLFSAGTFLYVATVHVLPEVTSSGTGHGHLTFTKCELLMLVVGSLMPLFLTIGHHH